MPLVAAPVLAQSLESYPVADHDGDGIPTLEEMLRGTDPLVAEYLTDPATDKSVSARSRQASRTVSGTSSSLYDVDFGTPPHTLYTLPVLDTNAAPRLGPSSVRGFMGNPSVEPGLGALDDQVAVFREGGQLAFDLRGLPASSSGYIIEYDVYVDNMNPSTVNNHFKVLLDSPQVRTLNFTGGGSAYTFIPFGERRQGSYQTGKVIHVKMIVDLERELWTITLDDDEWRPIDFLADELHAVRVSMGTSYDDNVVAIDNFSIRSLPVDDLGVAPETEFWSIGFAGGPFTPASKVYTITNPGPSTVTWTASSDAEYVSIDPPTGQIVGGGSTVVDISTASDAQQLPPGTYADVIIFSNVASGIVNVRPITLIIESPEVTVDIKVNGSDGPLVVPSSNALFVTVSVDAGAHQGVPADWWLVARTSQGWYYYNPQVSLWERGFRVSFMGNLIDIPSLLVYDSIPRPPGLIRAYLAVETPMDGVLQFDNLTFDSITIHP